MDTMLTAKQVAERLNCSVSLVRREDMKAALGAVVIGKRTIRYPKEAVEAYIASLQRQMAQSWQGVSRVRVKDRDCRKLTSRHALW